MSDTKRQNAKKGKAIEVRVRIFEVYRLLLRGNGRPEIIHYALEKWKLSEGSIDQYIKKAMLWMDKLYEHRGEQGLKLSISRRTMLMEKAIQAGDLTTAHDIMKDLDKLLNQYPAIRIKSSLDAGKGLVDLLNGSSVDETKAKLKKD